MSAICNAGAHALYLFIVYDLRASSFTHTQATESIGR